MFRINRPLVHFQGDFLDFLLRNELPQRLLQSSYQLPRPFSPFRFSYSVNRYEEFSFQSGKIVV